MKKNNEIIQNSISLESTVVKKAELTLKKNTKKFKENSFDLDLQNKVYKNDNFVFSTDFHIIINNIYEEGLYLEIKIYFSATFRCTNQIDDSFLESPFCKISAPAISFPFLRAFVSTLSTQAGYPSILLPSINFVQFANNKKYSKNNN